MREKEGERREREREVQRMKEREDGMLRESASEKLVPRVGEGKTREEKKEELLHCPCYVPFAVRLQYQRHIRAE